MEITKANDIFVAVLNNPNATTTDLMSLKLTPDNTSLYTKDQYKQSKLVQDTFKTPDGQFNEVAFNDAYKLALNHYSEMTDDKYIKSLGEVMYSPFDITRPKDAKTFQINVEFSKDFNPFKQTYGRTGLNSVNESNLSLRELAQQGKVFDPITQTWSEESANDLGLFSKFFGDTLVYGQWDDEGTHIDPETGRTINHKKGDWKTNADGNLFLEKLGNREIYGKQVVNPMDMLTTDGSAANQLDFFDSDSREKSALKTTLKIGAEIAPLLIPGFNTYYGGVKAALGLASVLPTFYKSLEGLLLGDTKTGATDVMTAAEGYLSKFIETSVSDEGQGSMFNYEQTGQMVASVFSQIYEQRAMASLSKYIMKNPVNLAAKEQEYAKEINKNLFLAGKVGKIDPNNMDEILALRQSAISKIPELVSFQKSQSNLAKSLSLGYMALTSTSDIYGQALQGGYDRRTAGFAALAAATGQYGIMINNRMGDWFLDKTTGYTTETNKALVRKSVTEYMEPIKKALNTYASNPIKGKAELAGAFKGIKNKLYDIFTSPSELGEALFKNAFIEGVEEVTEQAVLDATKGIVDTMSYLGMTKKEGSLGGWNNVFSEAGFENYLSNLVGGILGGAMFEFNTRRLEPMLSGKPLNEDTQRTVYQLVGNGQTQLLIDEVNRQRSKLGNNYISPTLQTGENVPTEGGKSQADAIADITIAMIKNVDGIMNAKGLVKSDAEIIEKAMIDHLIIKDLEAPKGTDKIGIEGLVIDDFRNIAAKITDYQSEIKKLSANDIDKETNKEKIKELTSLSKEQETKIADLLEGKHAEEYYDQAMVYLTKEVSEPWMAIDKEVYTRAKYGKEFKDLPEKGYSITQEQVTKEWKDSLESKDVRKNIAVITNAYKTFEKDINPTFDDYFKTGYSEEAAKTYKNLIDLDSTIKMFNTETSPEKRQELLDRFKFINGELKKNPKVNLNILPWTVYQGDFAKNILQYGMVGKPRIDEDGQFVIDPNTGQIALDHLTTEDLEKESEGGIKYKDSLEKTLNLLFSEVPMNPLDVDGSINILNTMLASSNKKIDLEMMKIASKGDLTAEDQAKLQELESLKYNFFLLPFQESLQTSEQKNTLNLNLVNLYNQIENDKGITSNVIELYKSGKYYDLNVDELSQERQGLQWLFNLSASEITPEFIETLSPEQIASFENSSLNSLTNQNKDFYNRLLEAKAQLSVAEVIQNQTETLDTFIEKEKDLTDDFVSEVEKMKPDVFKMRNYALDLLLDQLKGANGNPINLDREVRLEAEKQVKTIVDNYTKEFFPNMTFDSADDVLYFVNNAKQIDDKISNSKHINTLVDDEFDPDEKTLILDYSERALLAEGFEDVFNKYISTSEAQNGTFISNLHKLAIFKGTLNGLDQVNSFLELKQKGFSDIANPLYNFLENLELSLQLKTTNNGPTVFSILEREEKSLLTASDINNFLTEGIKLADIQNAINLLKLARSAVYAMSTTQITTEEPYGFIASRQNFLRKNGIESESLNLKTVSSDIATLMVHDLDRLQVKLQFYLDLAKSNSAKVFNEHEIIRGKMTEIFKSKLLDLSKSLPFIKIKVQIDDIEKDSNKTPEKKLMEIESLIYEHFQSEDKKALLQELFKDSKIIIDARKLSKMSKEVEKGDILDYDFAIYVATILSVHARDFHSKMHGLLSDFDKAPFFIQELAMKTAYASIVDPELFSTVVDMDSTNIQNNVTNLITYVLGNQGTGKTTVIFKMLLKYLQKNNPSLALWMVAPDQDQVDKLTREVLENVNFSGSQESLNKLALYNKLGIKDEMISLINDLHEGKKETSAYKINDNDRFELKEDFLNTLFSKAFKDSQGVQITNLPNLIFIDEVTHFSSIELEILNKLVQTLPKENFIKIIGAGDTSQAGFKFGQKETSAEINVDRVNGIFTPKMLVTVRAANVWQRENADLMVTLSEQITDKFHDAELAKDKSRDATQEAQLLIDSYRSQNLFNLKYFRNNNILNGTLIVDNLTDDIINTLSNIITTDSTKTIGILTESGNYDYYRDALLKLKLLTPDNVLDSRVKIFSLANIQGNEVDYFLFDTDLIKSSKIHHILKDFYTYTFRSKDASIIIDRNKTFSGKYNIINTAQTGTDIREPLNVDLISKTREQRIETLRGLLDGNFEVKFDRFMFSGDIPLETTDVNDSLLTEKDLSKPPLYFSPPAETNIPDNFEYMFHSFYNNPNTKLKQITDSKGNVTDVKIDEIDYDESRGNSDLNLSNVDKNDTDAIVDGWLKIKNQYLFDNQLPGDENSLKFIQNIFGSDSTPSKLKVSTVLVASKFNPDVNLPVFKFGFDITQTLNKGDIFMNVALKIEDHSGKIHYVTLAALSSNTIKSAFGEDSNSYKLYAAKLKEWKTLDFDGIKEIASDIKFNNQITSLRFVKDIKEKTFVKDYVSTFKGTQRSKLMFFPVSEPQFYDLVNNYSFGEMRKIEDTTIEKNGKSYTITGLKSLYELYKGKPYVVVSYASDLKGAKGQNTQAKLVPLFTEGRSFDDTRKDIKELRSIKFAGGLSVEENKTVNILFKNIASITQMVKLLIQLSEQFPEVYDALLTPRGPFKTSILDTMGKVIGDSKRSEHVLNRLNNLFTTIQSFRGKKTTEEIRLEVWPLLVDNTWKDYLSNILILDDLVKSSISSKDEKEVKEIYNEMLVDVGHFFESVKTILGSEKVYWETPKKFEAVVSSYEENPSSDLAKKLQKFQPESYLYTNGVPESPRFLFNLKSILEGKAEITPKVVKPEVVSQVESTLESVSPVEVEENVEEPEEVSILRNAFSPLIGRYAGKTNLTEKWKFEFANIFSSLSDADINKRPQALEILRLLSLEGDEANALSYDGFKSQLYNIFNITDSKTFKNNASLITQLSNLTNNTVEEIKNMITSQIKEHNCKL